MSREAHSCTTADSARRTETAEELSVPPLMIPSLTPVVAAEPTEQAATSQPAPSSTSDDPPVSTGMGCILYLHGAGTPPGDYDESWDAGIKYLGPRSGSSEFPWFWPYDGDYNFQNDPGDSNPPYTQLVSNLTTTHDSNGCGPTMMHGASNGGGFAARIYYSGEDFGGRLWGVMVDDRVPDAGVIGCSPSWNVRRSLFVHSTEVVETAASFVNDCCSDSPLVEYPWYCQDDIGFDLVEYEPHIGQESVWARVEHWPKTRTRSTFERSCSAGGTTSTPSRTPSSKAADPYTV